MISSCTSLAHFSSPLASRCALPLLTLIVAVAAIALAQAQIIPYPCAYAGAGLMSLTFVLYALRSALHRQEVLALRKDGAWPEQMADELLLTIFRNLGQHDLTRASLVCRQWRLLAQDPLLLPSLLPGMNWYGKEDNTLQALAAYNALGTHHHPRFITTIPRGELEVFSGNRWFCLDQMREGFYKIAVHTFNSHNNDLPSPEIFYFSSKKLIHINAAATHGNYIYAASRNSIRCFSLGNEKALHGYCGRDFVIESLFVTRDEIMVFGCEVMSAGKSLWVFSKDLSQRYKVDCPQMQDSTLEGALGYQHWLILLYYYAVDRKKQSKIILWNRFENELEEIYVGGWVKRIHLSNTTLILERVGTYSFYNLETKKWFESKTLGTFVGAAGGILFADATERDLNLYDYRKAPGQDLNLQIGS